MFNISLTLFYNITEIIIIHSFLQSNLSFLLLDQIPLLIDQKKIECATESNWSSYALDINSWEDDKAPVVKLRNLKEITYDDLEFCGFSTDRLIGVGKSFLTKSLETNLYILSKCIMRNMVHYFRLDK